MATKKKVLVFPKCQSAIDGLVTQITHMYVTVLQKIIISVWFFLQQRYGHNPLSLYTTIRACLHAEMSLVQRAEQV